MKTFDDLADTLAAHLDQAVATFAEPGLKMLPTCVAPRKRSWEIRRVGERECVVSITLSDGDGLSARLKMGSAWLHGVSFGSKDPAIVLREISGVVLSMLMRQKRDAA